MFKFFKLITAVAVIILAVPGCGTMRKANETRWVISFHLKAQAEECENLLVMKVRELDSDKTHLIRRLPLSSSRHILFGEPVIEDGKTVAVKFTIDPFQRLKWMQITTEYGGRQVAVCIDGYYRFLWRVPFRYDSEKHQITVKGPWDAREAELVCEWAPQNYKNLQNDPVFPRKK